MPPLTALYGSVVDLLATWTGSRRMQAAALRHRARQNVKLVHALAAAGRPDLARALANVAIGLRETATQLAGPDRAERRIDRISDDEIDRRIKKIIEDYPAVD